MLPCFQHHFGTAKHRLCRHFDSIRAANAFANCRIRHCFNQHENIRRTAAADRNEAVKQFLVNDRRFANCIKNTLRIRQISRGERRLAANCGHASPHQRGRIRHHTQQRRGRSGNFAGEHVHRPAGRNRHQRAVIDFPLDAVQQFAQHLRFHRQHNHTALLRQRLGIRRAGQPRNFRCQCLTLSLAVQARHHVFRRHIAGRNHTTQNCAAHIADANHTNLFHIRSLLFTDMRIIP